MQKTILAFLVLASCTVAEAQKIKIDETDKFTKQRRIETSSERMVNDFGAIMSVKLRAVDTSYFLNIEGSGKGTFVIGDKYKLLLLLDNDSTITTYSTGVQSIDVQKSGDFYDHQYSLAKKDIEAISAHKVKSVRVYGRDSYADIDVKENRASILPALCKIFLAALDKLPV